MTPKTMIRHFIFIAALGATVSVWAQKPPTPAGGATVDEERPVRKPTVGKARSGMTGTLIVLNKAEASASLLDLATGEEVARIATGVGPHEVAISPDGKTAVVCNYGRSEPGHSLTIIDIPAMKALRTIDLETYHKPHGIVFMPDGKRIVVTAEPEQKLLVVDITSGNIEMAIDTGARTSHMVAMTPDAKRAFVANIDSGSISAIDLESGERLAIIETAEGSEGIDVSPDGREVWVTNRKADTVTVIDTQTLRILATIESPSFPIRIKFTPDGKRALVSNARSGEVAVFDTATRKEISRIRMDEEIVDDDVERLFANSFEGSPVPIGILVMPDGSHAFIANTKADVVTVIDLDRLKVVGRLRAGKEPDGLAYTSLVLK